MMGRQWAVVSVGREEEEEEEEESLFRADAVNREEKETRLFHGMRMAPGTCRIGHRHRV
jgi:hypothetical protein